MMEAAGWRVSEEKETMMVFEQDGCEMAGVRFLML